MVRRFVYFQASECARRQSLALDFTERGIPQLGQPAGFACDQLRPQRRMGVGVVAGRVVRGAARGRAHSASLPSIQL